MRKKKSIIGISVVATLFMALAGCGKANDEVIQEHINNIDDNGVAQQVEAPEEPIITTGFTGDLFTKRNAQVVYPTATLHYTGDSDVNATNGNVTELLGLDSLIFTATYARNNGSSAMGLKTSAIWMYGYKQDSVKGNKLTVSIASGYLIKSIFIDFVEPEKSNMAEISSGGSLKEETNGSYVINSDSFMIFINNSTVDVNTPIKFRSIVIEYVLPTARETIEFGLTTDTSLSYNYSKEGNGSIDTLNRGNTYDLSEESTSGYKNWSNSAFDTHVSYIGNTNSTYNSINLRTDGKTSGIITTSNTDNHDIKVITINWNTNTTDGRTVQVYGQNDPYSAASDLYAAGTQGTLIGSASYNESDPIKQSTIEIVGSYKYIGIKSSSGALFIDSLNIQWGVIPVYSYSNVAIRFGNMIEQNLWADLSAESTIKGYGVMLSTPGYLNGSKIKEWYSDNSLASIGEDDLNDAIASACGANTGAVKNFYTKITGEKTNPAEATVEQKDGLEGDYYIWNLYKNISTSPDHRLTEYTAVAYIRVESGIVFLKETTASVKGLANDLINSAAYDETSFDGSLNNLANLA